MIDESSVEQQAKDVEDEVTAEMGGSRYASVGLKSFIAFSTKSSSSSSSVVVN